MVERKARKGFGTLRKQTLGIQGRNHIDRTYQGDGRETFQSE